MKISWYALGILKLTQSMYPCHVTDSGIEALTYVHDGNSQLRYGGTICCLEQKTLQI